MDKAVFPAVKAFNINLSKNSDGEEKITEFKWVTKEEFLSSEYNVSHNSLKELIKKL